MQKRLVKIQRAQVVSFKRAPTLKEVIGIDFAFAKTNDNRWPNVLDQVMSWDQCRFVDDEWAMFLLCWNDAGGPVFYVPKYLWAVARVAEHVAETERHWNAGK